MRRSKFETWYTVKTTAKIKTFFWRLVSSNGETICSGEPNGYNSAASRDKGIRAVRRTALLARLVELSWSVDE